MAHQQFAMSMTFPILFSHWASLLPFCHRFNVLLPFFFYFIVANSHFSNYLSQPNNFFFRLTMPPSLVLISLLFYFCFLVQTCPKSKNDFYQWANPRKFYVLLCPHLFSSVSIKMYNYSNNVKIQRTAMDIK